MMTHNAKPSGKRPGPGYKLHGGVPWPTFADGTMYADRLGRVYHADAPENTGRIQSLEYTHPDGTYMKERVKVRKATVTMPERRETKPGKWLAIVSWDEREGHERLLARCDMANLVPLEPSA